MNNRRLERLYEQVENLRPERITIHIKKGDSIVEVPVCTFHRMLHNKEAQYEDMVSTWNRPFANMGNCVADLDAWLHILKRHSTGIHGELCKERVNNGLDRLSEYEEHENLLKDMARRQTVKL